MAFQFTISPGAPKPKSIPKPSNEKQEEISCLCLAPFTPNVKMCFENVVIGTVRTQKLLLENPGANDIEVSIKNLPLPERQVKLNWYIQIIPASNAIMLEITWSPIMEEAWRHTFTFEVGRFLKKDVSVSFISVPAKKVKPIKSRSGKHTVICKKLKTPPKKMISPKTRMSLHKPNTVLQKQGSSPKQKQLVISNSTYTRASNKYWNKENLNPCLQSKLTPLLKCNENDIFCSPNNTSFNIETTNNDIRRSTYTVKTLNSNIQKYIKEDIYNDSLEESPNSKHPATISLCNNYEINEYLSKTSTTVLHSFNAIPVENNINAIKSKLDSSLFEFTPVKSVTGEFNPNSCSTTYRSSNSGTKKKAPEELKCDIESKPIEIVIDENSLANISSETYVKGNVSSETYVKGNVSCETYIVNGNLSSGTYTKDNSRGDLTGLDVLPHSSKHTLTPLRNKSLFEEFVSDSDSVFLSPIVKDASILHQASMSGENVRSIIEANLWSDNRNKCLSLINEEEERSMQVSNLTKTLKRKSTSVINVSPPKKLVLDSSRRTPDHFPNLKWNRSKPVQVKQLVRRSIEYLDPFMTASLYHDQQWMDEQEVRFQKWLNALLTPPAELDSDIDVHPVDVGKLWQQCKNKAVPIAPSKETISNEYHTSKRLDALRKAASDLFKSRELSEVLMKVQLVVESGKLSIRKDKDVHLDLGLQSEVMRLFLSYNPLWLRIGLETIYGVTIQLSSNSDIMGLGSFIMHRFFKDLYLIKRHKTVHSPKYVLDIKKFILKKFLTLVYFLDVAKSKVLIAHDPCLFCKNAPVKESREILLIFSKELLCAVGDVTKFLRFTGYVVSHKQRYIHEFDYSVIHLGTDLRDGVRLTKVMEIILMQTGLTDNLRVPAISILQKVHNMKIVFEALEQANFEIVGDISPKDIVNGHHEKTLSFLWQIIYKFQAPRFIKASTVIQVWWRSFSIVIKRRILFRKKSAAAKKIQAWYRRQKMAYKLKTLAPLIKDYLKRNNRERNAIKIQSYYRMVVQRRSYIKLRQSVIHLQKYIRGYLVRQSAQKKIYASIKIQAFIRMCILRNRYCKFRAAAINIQQIYRAKHLMLLQQERYIKLRNSVVFIQRLFRANKEMKVERENFIALKAAAITIQRHFQVTRKMKIERERYLRQKTAALVIQSHFRALKQMKLERMKYQRLKHAAICIQLHFRACRLTQIEYNNYQTLKLSTITIQQHFRATLKMRIEYEYFRKLKAATIMVQRHYRAKKAMIVERNKFKNIQKAAITIQRIYKANRAARIEHANFERLKMITIDIQRRFRANKLMRTEIAKFQEIRNVVISIQRRFRANITMKMNRIQFLEYKRATIDIQRRFRANQKMKMEYIQYQELRKAAQFVQTRFRARKAAEDKRKKFLELKSATITIQRRYRANLTMRIEYANYQKLKNATVVLQTRYRANKMMKTTYHEYLELRKVTINIQRRFRANCSMKLEVAKFHQLKCATITLQRRFTATRVMKAELEKFQQFRKAVITVQRRFRANQSMKKCRMEFQQARNAIINLQRRYRAKITMRIEHANYQNLKNTTVILQTRYRANKIMKNTRQEYLELKRVTINIQRRFRVNCLMKKDTAKLHQLRCTTITLQRRFRATRVMRVESAKFQQFRKTVITVQRRFRANQSMRKCRMEFQQARIAIINLQRRYRANLTMRIEHANYQKLKNATVVLQTRHRANKIMKTTCQEYLKLKRVTINIQRRFRANCSMKKEVAKFHQLKCATIMLQRRFRATIIMRAELNKFQQFRKAVITVQRRFRANQLMRKYSIELQQARNVIVSLQRRFRANKSMEIDRNRFLKIKKATLTIQRKFRQFQVMKMEQSRYQNLRNTSITIQRRFRATREMRIAYNKFLELKIAVISVQRRFRANQQMKIATAEYNRLKNAAIVIQRSYRSRRLMKTDYDKFQKMKRAASVIQEWFRAYQYMRIESTKFQTMKQAAILLQRRFRANKAMRVEHLRFVKLKEAVLVLQKQLRRLKETKNDRKRYSEILKRRHTAATKIQTVWRGYHIRKEYPQLTKIREKLEEITSKAVVYDTLGNRRERALQRLISFAPTLRQIIYDLEDLEFITRRCRDTCIKMSNLLSEQLYVTISSTNRSPAEIQACTAATSILINFCKHPPARPSAWCPQYMDTIVTVMNHSCDKEEKLFPYLCTLLWLLAHNTEYKEVILAIPKCSQKLMKIKSLCFRKHKMVSLQQHKTASYFSSYINLPEPSLSPDWGLDYLERPRTFSNSVHAFNCVLKILDH